jgi:hypothetical protein
VSFRPDTDMPDTVTNGTQQSTQSHRALLLPGGAVDALAKQVSVPVVPRVLLDEVDKDPAEGEGATPVPVAGRVQRGRGRDQFPGVRALRLPGRQRLVRVGVGDLAEGSVLA